MHRDWDDGNKLKLEQKKNTTFIHYVKYIRTYALNPNLQLPEIVHGRIDKNRTLNSSFTIEQSWHQ